MNQMDNKELKLLERYTTEFGNTVEVYLSPNPISKKEFYKELAKIEYDFQMWLRNKDDSPQSTLKTTKTIRNNS